MSAVRSARTEATARTVASADGTTIAYDRTGAGAPGRN
jgi:hypothetical protein